jgi:hypothetical protein
MSDVELKPSNLISTLEEEECPTRQFIRNSNEFNKYLRPKTSDQIRDKSSKT